MGGVRGYYGWWGGYGGYGYYRGGKCKDKMPYKKCKELMEDGKCEDEKVAKICMKTCDMCEDQGPKKSTTPNIDLINVLSIVSCTGPKNPPLISKVGVSHRKK